MQNIHYLANLNVHINPYIANHKAFQEKINEAYHIPEISGLEIRLEGDRLDKKSCEIITQVCEDASDRGMLFLHLSNYGLRALDEIKGLADYFSLIIGHYGKHENAFGQPDKSRSIKPLLARKKLVIENGSRIDNCLPKVYEYARRHDLNMTLDMGHFILGLIEKDMQKNTPPADGLHKYVHHVNGTDQLQYNDAYFAELGRIITHLHAHGVDTKTGVLTDHVVPSKDTIRGVQPEILRRIMHNARIASATVELKEGCRTKENIKATITNFKEMFC
jgi:hypothetical protein